MNRCTNYRTASEVWATIKARGDTCAVWYTGDSYQVTKRHTHAFEARLERDPDSLVGVYRPKGLTIAMLNVDMQQTERDVA